MKKLVGIIFVLAMMLFLSSCCWPYYHHGYYPGDHGGYEHHDRGGNHDWDSSRDRY